jgi:arylsulfatase A-like enzyme
MRLIPAILVSGFFTAFIHAAGTAEHIVVVVWDGMRPDFISERNTPTLHSLAREGVFFANHHPVYPSATEVNGTAISTGAHPAHSGITANKEYRPRINPLKPLSTESLEAVRGGDRLTQGHYLNLPTLAEIVQAAGGRTAVAGTKPVALLHDRKEKLSGQEMSRVLFYDRTLPTNCWAQLQKELGPYPVYASPNVGRDSWSTRVLTGPFWSGGVPVFSLLWLCEPDFSQHDTGPGSETSLAAIRSSDANLRRVLDELNRRDLRGKTDVLVVSDHGFSTITQSVDIAAALQDAGFRAIRDFYDPPETDDILVVSNGGATLLYVIGHEMSLVRRVVAFLQGQPFAGVIFTRKPVDGAFTLDQARIESADSPDILLALRWSPDRSTNGTPGLVYCDEAGRKPGQGMHVTLSRFDMHNTLIAAGPDFHKGTVDDLPSGNLDVAPTVLWILGIKPPRPMDGRVLTEALTVEGPKIGAPVTSRIEATHQSEQFTWRQYLKWTQLNGVIYFDEGNGAAVPR